jgi:hypothetical protein
MFRTTTFLFEILSLLTVYDIINQVVVLTLTFAVLLMQPLLQMIVYNKAQRNVCIVPNKVTELAEF